MHLLSRVPICASCFCIFWLGQVYASTQGTAQTPIDPPPGVPSSGNTAYSTTPTSPPALPQSPTTSTATPPTYPPPKSPSNVPYSQGSGYVGTKTGAQSNGGTSATTPSRMTNSPLSSTSKSKVAATSGRFPPKNPQCNPQPLSLDTWNKNHLADYLKKYPGGDKLTLVQYATKLNMTNFVCGIGGACHAGQPCYPLESIDWYILFAIQQWNTYMNIYYDAVGYGIAIVQSSMNAVIASLFPASDNTAIRNMKSNWGIQASLTQVSGTVLMDLMLFCGMETGPFMFVFNELNFMLAAAMGFAAFGIQEPPGPLKDGFEQWSNVAFYLTKYEEVIHKQVSEEAKKRINSGISTEEGLYGVIKDGHFIDPAKMIPLPKVEKQIRNVTLALSINMLFHSINAFIAVGSDPCKDKGKNGARPEGNTLSWCDKPDGTMHNIVIAKGDKTYNEINNANVINDNFGFSTELIIQSSIKCQAMNKGWNYIPWANQTGALPKSPESDCVFNLPVCYTQDKAIHKKIHKKDWTVAKACRHSGHLPLDKN